MIFADGALSDYRSHCFESFPRFDPPRFGLFANVSRVQSVNDLQLKAVIPGLDSGRQSSTLSCHLVYAYISSALTRKNDPIRHAWHAGEGYFWLTLFNKNHYPVIHTERHVHNQEMR
jgi:hypothetical protein